MEVNSDDAWLRAVCRKLASCECRAMLEPKIKATLNIAGSSAAHRLWRRLKVPILPPLCFASDSHGSFCPTPYWALFSLAPRGVRRGLLACLRLPAPFPSCAFPCGHPAKPPTSCFWIPAIVHRGSL